MLTLVIGGARSGKSGYALSLGEGREDVVFVATASVEDDAEMLDRIERHRAERPRSWKTLEAPIAVVETIESSPESALVVVDCITLWISNLQFAQRELTRDEREGRIVAKVCALAELGERRDLVVVTNEVGAGLVPETAVGREFRDLQGRANQALAGAAKRVVWMVAGVPVPIKSPRLDSAASK